MASTRMILMTGVVVVLCLFLQMEMYSAMRIRIRPSRFRGGKEKEVNVSCTLDSAESAAKEIMLLKIARKGEKAIAIIHPNNTITYISGNANDFPATGAIDHDISKSFLNLIIKDPLPEDSGAYSCNIFYIDEMGVLVEGRASGYLMVDDPEVKKLKETVKMLVAKVNKGEKLILEYRVKAEEYLKKIDGLESASNLQAMQISNIASKEQQYTGTINGIENKTDSQVDEVSQLVQKEAFYRQKVAEMLAKFNVQEKKIANLLQKESKYSTKISDMETALGIQSKQISNLMNTVSKFTTKLSDIETDSKKTSTLVTDLATKGKVLDMTVTNAVRKVDQALSQIGNSQGVPDPLIAFSATNQNAYMKAETSADLIFPDVTFQEGQGYDPKTGIFTAPVDGLYAFHLALKLSCKGCAARVQLIADLRVLIRLKVGMTGDEHQGSVSAVAKLKKGEEVFNRVDFATSRALLTMSQLSVFSGYLINAGS